MLHPVALVRTDVSEESSAPIIKETRIGEPGTTLAVTNNRSTPRNTPEDDMLHTHGHDKLKSYITLTVWAL
jgi:hypothetical protein